MTTFKYIISGAIVVLFSLTVHAQTKVPQKKTRPKYEVPDDRPSYIRLSIDPTRYLYPYVDGIKRGGIELALDTEFKGRYFPVAEVGSEFVTLDESNYQLSGNGAFFRIGIDNNFLKYQSNNDRDMFFMGVRMAYAYLSQDAENIIVNNNGQIVRFDYPNLNYNAFWAEITMGIKTELTKNLFLGWTVRGKKLLSTSNRVIEPYLIPGYGKYQIKFNIAANIFISYSLPLSKSKTDGTHPEH